MVWSTNFTYFEEKKKQDNFKICIIILNLFLLFLLWCTSIFRLYGLGFEHYLIFVLLLRERIMFPYLNWNKFLLLGQLPLSYEYYFLRSWQQFLVPPYFDLPDRYNASCTPLQQNRWDMTFNLGIICVASHPIILVDSC